MTLLEYLKSRICFLESVNIKLININLKKLNYFS